jgi:uncharacterized protein
MGRMGYSDKYGPWALITGASSGLGEQYARQLAARGLNLVVVARRAERLRTLAGELVQAHEIEVEVLPLDLLAANSLTAIQRVTDRVDLGLVVCNAGFGASGRFLEQNPTLLQDMVRLNCEIPVLLIHALAPKLIRREHSGILVLASTAAFQSTPWMATYGATKAFDLHLAEALTVELGGHGVDVLSVCPGHTATEFHQIAGVHQAAVGGAADPAQVVRQSLNQLGRRITFVHGRMNRLLAFSQRLVPRSISAWATGRILGRRLP